MPSARPRWVTARKQHRCDVREHYPVPCPLVIQPGERYVRLVEFPGDVNSDTAPWVMRKCETCARGGYPIGLPEEDA